MYKKYLFIVSALAVIGFILISTGCGPTAINPNSTDNATNQSGQAKQPLRKVQILLDWKAEPTYAGFFIAKQRQFYEKRGLDVEIVEGNGATTSAQIIGAGNTYFIGSCSGEATAIAKSKGIPVRSVAVFYPNVPTVLYSRGDTPIRTPSDMIGKTIGLISGSVTTDEYRGLVAANKIDRSKIKEVAAGFDVAPLLSKKVDGLMNYEELTPVELRLQGYDIVTMRFADFGLKAYSLNLIVNEAQSETERDTIKAITEATIEGYEFLRSNPDEAAMIFSSLYPERDRAYVRDSIQIVAKLLGSGRIGEQTSQGWNDTLGTLKSLKLLEREIKAEDVSLNGYVAGN